MLPSADSSATPQVVFVVPRSMPMNLLFRVAVACSIQGNSFCLRIPFGILRRTRKTIRPLSLLWAMQDETSRSHEASGEGECEPVPHEAESLVHLHLLLLRPEIH